MAEALKMVSLERLGAEITCPQCHRQYTDPRVLSCCHYFCRTCVEKLVAAEGNVLCPTCDGETQITEDDATSLPVAFLVNRLKELHSRVAKLEKKMEGPCEMCSGGKVEEFCLQCAEFVCAECARSHRRMKAKFPDHRVQSLAELREGGVMNSLPVNAERPQPPGKCPDHEEPLKLFCFDCNRLICRDCTVIEHSQHRYDFVKKSASRCRETLAESLAPLKSLQSEIAEVGKDSEAVRRNVAAQEAYAMEHIEQKFEEIFQALQDRKEELLRETAKLVKEKTEALVLQGKGLRLAAEGVARVVKYVEKNLELVADEELVVQYHQLLLRVGAETKRHEELSLLPLETANLAASVSCADDVIQACKTKAKVYVFPIQESEVHTAEVGIATTHYIIDHSYTGHEQPERMEACLKSLVDGSTSPARVKQTGKGLFEVSYTPRVRGRHELTVDIEGRTVAGSPFLVFVKIPPSSLREPVAVIEGLRHPYSVAFDANHHVLVTESDGQKVRVLQRNRLAMTDFAEHKMENPTGLALDRDGNIYIANVFSHTVSKYDVNGKCMKFVGREGNQSGEFSHPSGLAVVGEKVFVCDRNNSRIQVFTRDLEFLCSFGCHGNQDGQLHWPYDVVEGSGGQLYVTDCDNHRIQVFDDEGQFVHAFGSRGCGQNNLKRPVGICLGQDELLYVTEYTRHCVSVFHPGGEYVGSFGTYGRKKGNFCYPVGIAIDSDGFVFVCDQGNNRIQVF